jgi:metal-responsive CopG/Arc/MetJ family transcriptional regulator
MFGTKKIALDKALYERIERVATQAGYPSAQEFVVHLLEQQVRHLEEAKDEEEVRKRLEGLGYID